MCMLFVVCLFNSIRHISMGCTSLEFNSFDAISHRSWCFGVRVLIRSHVLKLNVKVVLVDFYFFINTTTSTQSAHFSLNPLTKRRILLQRKWNKRLVEVLHYHQFAHLLFPKMLNSLTKCKHARKQWYNEHQVYMPLPFEIQISLQFPKPIIVIIIIKIASAFHSAISPFKRIHLIVCLRTKQIRMFSQNHKMLLPVRSFHLRMQYGFVITVVFNPSEIIISRAISIKTKSRHSTQCTRTTCICCAAKVKWWLEKRFISHILKVF